MKKQNSVSKDNTFWEIQYGHKPTLFPNKFYVFAGSKREAKKSTKDRWHGHEYACDTKITKIVKKEEGWRPWKD